MLKNEWPSKKLNLTGLKFSNTTGYDASGHYGTAKDILKLLEYALENPTFKKYMKQKNIHYQMV